MDTAPPSGGGDWGFESPLDRFCFFGLEQLQIEGLFGKRIPYRRRFDPVRGFAYGKLNCILEFPEQTILFMHVIHGKLTVFVAI
jgi:hypothetical protein